MHTEQPPKNSQSNPNKDANAASAVKDNRTPEAAATPVTPAQLVLRARWAGFEASSTIRDNYNISILFARMERGTFKIIPYTESEIAADESKRGQVHTILFRSPFGDNMELSLRGGRNPGWTEYAAKSLIFSLQREKENPASVDPQKVEELQKKWRFEEVQTHTLSSESTAILESMHNGEARWLMYPEAEIQKTPEKKGRVHTIVYKLGDRYFIKKLHKENLNGWTAAEAEAVVVGLQKAENKPEQEH